MESIVVELPQNRMIEPYEVAHVCAYLCHPMSRSITGTVQKLMAVGIYKLATLTG